METPLKLCPARFWQDVFCFVGSPESFHSGTIISQNSHRGDQYMIAMDRSGIDRRSGADRRIGLSIRYWLNDGVERRQWKERRSEFERRTDWVRLGPWHSAFVGDLIQHS